MLSGLEMIHFFKRLFAAIACFVIVFPPHLLILVLRRTRLKCFIFTQKSQSFFGLAFGIMLALQTALQSPR